MSQTLFNQERSSIDISLQASSQAKIYQKVISKLESELIESNSERKMLESEIESLKSKLIKRDMKISTSQALSGQLEKDLLRKTSLLQEEISQVETLKEKVGFLTEDKKAMQERLVLFDEISHKLNEQT